MKRFFKRVFGMVGGQVDKEILEDRIIGVVGHQTVQDFLANLFESNKDMNVLFVGSPATGKTLILKNIERMFKKVAIRFDFSTTTGRGFINYLIDKKLEREGGQSKIKKILVGDEILKDNILLLDEIDKIKPLSDLNMILQLLEGKEINYIKYRTYFRIKFTGRMRVFGTCNKVGKLSAALQSRFLIWPLKDYTEDEYIEIGRKLAELHLDEPDPEARIGIATAFAKAVYKSKKKDMRQLVHYMKLWSVYRSNGNTKTVDEILALVPDLPEELE
jgi:MoxR-like ATPase